MENGIAQFVVRSVMLLVVVLVLLQYCENYYISTPTYSSACSHNSSSGYVTVSIPAAGTILELSRNYRITLSI